MMDFIYGAALLVATFAFYYAARITYRNQASELDPASFGAVGLVALVITAFGAAGIAEMAQAFALHWSPIGLAEGAAAIAVVVFASLAAYRSIRRALVDANNDVTPTGGR